jgi:hypothetical protein
LRHDARRRCNALRRRSIGSDVPIAEHLVATTRGRVRVLLQPEHAVWLWTRLMAAFPDALSLVLMPDHLHFVVLPGLRLQLIHVLSRFTARTGIRFDVLEPEPIHSRDIAGRKIRYGFFNPLRARSVDDPWRWRWSTLRDLGGAAYPCWTSLDRVAEFLGVRPAVALRKLTSIGECRPPLLRTERAAIASVEGVRAAVAATLRIRIEEVATRPLGRRLVIQACEAVASPTARRLAAELECGVRSVFRLRTPQHPALPAVLTCLRDDRLR